LLKPGFQGTRGSGNVQSVAPAGVDAGTVAGNLSLGIALGDIGAQALLKFCTAIPSWLRRRLLLQAAVIRMPADARTDRVFRENAIQRSRMEIQR
jgi:hypothetical protein